MANSTPSYLGQVNQSGDAKALFEKIMLGEVLTTFERKSVMLDKQTIKTIEHGKSASFPAAGIATAAYHVPGTEITGAGINHAEKVITIDDMLLASAFITNMDEAMNHWDARSIYTAELANALAKQFDQHCLQTGVLAARASAYVTGRPGGTVIGTNYTGAPASADYLTNGAHLAKAIFLAAQKLDENDVAEEGRFCFVRPAQYAALLSTTDTINKDWGGMGSYADGNILRIGGVDIVKTNNLPSTDLSANTGVAAGTGYKYRGDFSKTAALIMNKTAIGTVKLLEMKTESEYDIRRQGTLFVAKYAVGTDWLRPESAVEIRQAVV